MTVEGSGLYYDAIPKEKKDLMRVVGESGRWQLQIFLQMFFILALVAVHSLSVTFLAPKQDHWCTRPADAANLTMEDWKDIGLPARDPQCRRYVNVSLSMLVDDYINKSSLQTQRCNSWEYDKSFYPSSLLSKWDLVCKRKWLVSASKSSFMVGMLISEILFGYLADRFGRKWVLVTASIINSVFSVLCLFASSILVFIVIRFFLAVGLGGYYNTAFIILMEVVVPEKRTMYGIIVQTGWSFGFVILPAVVWLIRDAFWIQAALAVPSILLMLASGFIPESPRWLISKGELEKARSILRKATETNRISGIGVETAIDEMIAVSKQAYDESKKQADKSIMDLLRIPGLRRIAIFLFIIWFINSFIYFGLSFNTNELSGDPFINFILSGALEFPACFLSLFFIRSIGRKRPLAAAMIFGGIVCLVLYLIPRDIPGTIVAAAMVGKFAITCSFGILYVFTAEIFPTVVRNAGLGWATVFENIGSIIAPFIRELGHATHSSIPQFLFGVLSMAGGAMVVFLPETNNHIVLDTLEEANISSKSKENNVQTTKSSIPVISNSKE